MPQKECILSEQVAPWESHPWLGVEVAYLRVARGSVLVLQECEAVSG
jgi:hypothetical protein